MSDDQQNANSTKSRLDRIESILETLVQDHLHFRREQKSLLGSQVILTDQVERISNLLATLVETQHAQTEAQQLMTELQGGLIEARRQIEERLAQFILHTDERLNALIAVADDLVRHRPIGQQP